MKKLKKGEVKCDECSGCGSIVKVKTTMVDLKHISYDMMSPCPKCKGDGKLDWVENVVGKKLSEEEEKREIMMEMFKNTQIKLSSGRKI